MIPYQYVLRRRMMSKLNKKLKLTISGTPHASRGYVQINGIKYSETTTIQLERNTSTSVTVSGLGAAASVQCYINLNGERVVTGAGTYSFALVDDAEIVFTLYNSAYGRAEITMPA